MTTHDTRAIGIEPVILTEESTVVARYEPAERDRTTYQSEAALEAAFIKQLQAQAYEYVRFDTEKLIQWASACISGNRYYDGPIP